MTLTQQQSCHAFESAMRNAMSMSCLVAHAHERHRRAGMGAARSAMSNSTTLAQNRLITAVCSRVLANRTKGHRSSVDHCAR